MLDTGHVRMCWTC